MIPRRKSFFTKPFSLVLLTAIFIIQLSSRPGNATVTHFPSIGIHDRVEQHLATKPDIPESIVSSASDMTVNYPYRSSTLSQPLESGRGDTGIHINDMSLHYALSVLQHYRNNPINQPLFRLEQPLFLQPEQDAVYFAHDETQLITVFPVRRILQFRLTLPVDLQVALVRISRGATEQPFTPTNETGINFINHLGFSTAELIKNSLSIPLLRSLGVMIPTFYERCVQLMSTNTKALASHSCRRMSLAEVVSGSNWNPNNSSSFDFMMQHITTTKLQRFYKLFKSEYKLMVTEKIGFTYDLTDISIGDWARYKFTAEFSIASRVGAATGTAHFPYQEILVPSSEDVDREEANWLVEKHLLEALAAVNPAVVKTICHRIFGNENEGSDTGHSSYWIRRDLLIRSICNIIQRLPVDMTVSLKHFLLIPESEVPQEAYERYRRFKKAINHPLTGSWNDIWRCRSSFHQLGDRERYSTSSLPDFMFPACYRSVLSALMVSHLKTLGTVALHKDTIGFIDRNIYQENAAADHECMRILTTDLPPRDAAALAAGAVEDLLSLDSEQVMRRSEFRQSVGCAAAFTVTDRQWALFYNFLPFTLLATSFDHSEAFNVMFQADNGLRNENHELKRGKEYADHCIDVSHRDGTKFNICRSDFHGFLTECIHGAIFKNVAKADRKCGLPGFAVQEILAAAHSSSVFVGHAEGIGEGAWPGLAASLYYSTTQSEKALSFLKENADLQFGYLALLGKSSAWITSSLATFIATAPLQWSSVELPLSLYHFMGNLTSQVLDVSHHDYYRLTGGFCTKRCWSIGGYVFQANNWTYENVLAEASSRTFPHDSLVHIQANHFLIPTGQFGDPVSNPLDAWLISRLHAETGWKAFTPLYGITHTGFLTSHIISKFHTFVSHCGFPGGKTWMTIEQPKWAEAQRSLDGKHNVGYKFWDRHENESAGSVPNRKMHVGYLSEAYKRGTLVMSTLDKLTLYTAERFNKDEFEVHIVDLMNPEIADSPFLFEVTGDATEATAWGLGETEAVEDTAISFSTICMRTPSGECKHSTDKIIGEDGLIFIEESHYTTNGIDLFFETYIKNWKLLTPFGKLHIIPIRYTQSVITEIAGLNLDALLITDPSMGPQTFRVCFTRYAPVQAIVWNNGMTSAQPQSVMDYYIASRAHVIEPPERAASRYSERLWLFNDSITYVPPNLVPSKQLPDELGFPASVMLESRQIIVFQHNVQKISPSMDAFLCSLLTLQFTPAPLYTFVTVGRWDGWAVLQRRLIASCARMLCDGYIEIPKEYYEDYDESRVNGQTRERDFLNKLDWENVRLYLQQCAASQRPETEWNALRKLWNHRTYFVPSQPLAEYARILQLATLSVDAFPFGGGLTTIDSLTQMTPVSTIASTIRSGRLSLAYYRLADFPPLESSNFVVKDNSCCFTSEDDCLGRSSLNEFVDSSASSLYPKFGKKGYGVVASSWCEYFENTVRLMRDHDHREKIVNVLKGHSHKLLEDRNAPRAWEQHLREMYRLSPFRED